MSSVWQILIGNLAIVSLFVSIWAHLFYSIRRFPQRNVNIAFGLFMGGSTVASMMLAVELRPGILFDLRYALIAVASLFGGPISAFLATIIAVGFRLSQGGSGAIHGCVSIGIMCCLGIGGYFATYRRGVTLYHVLGLGAAVAAALIVIMSVLSHQTHADTLRLVGAPAVILNFVATVVCGSALLHVRKIGLERDILSAALTQSPDFHYVKDRDSRFVIVNRNVAQYNGFSSPEEMAGLSDFDISTREHAIMLHQLEQNLIASGRGTDEHEEHMHDRFGNERFFISSKAPLFDIDGRVIGLAGVTRDITRHKILEHELRASRNLLSHAMSGMSDGFAMFDSAGFLVYCNEQYRQAFPLSADVRKPGSHIHDILRRILETGERGELPLDAGEEWVIKAAGTLHRNKNEELNMSDGRWLSLRTRLSDEGAAMVVVSDITAMKQAELSLRVLADQMKNLADIDGLTNLLNRRAFDERFAAELSRSLSDGRQVGLLMIDVDHFKRYNDTYGHLAGDECLRLVSDCLKKSVTRPSDIVARYGGEEFVMLLPDTGETGAMAVAERLLESLRAMKLPHSAGDQGIVTVSVGVTVSDPRSRDTSESYLITLADHALYRAKEQGRNCAVNSRDLAARNRTQNPGSHRVA